MPALTVAAIGVVFGDIGTSPLYALKEIFNGHHPIPVTPENILGILSLVFWSIMVLVTLKYVLIIMRADNRGEGGSLALLSLANNGVATMNWPSGPGTTQLCFFPFLTTLPKLHLPKWQRM